MLARVVLLELRLRSGAGAALGFATDEALVSRLSGLEESLTAVSLSGEASAELSDSAETSGTGAAAGACGAGASLNSGTLSTEAGLSRL